MTGDGEGHPDTSKTTENRWQQNNVSMDQQPNDWLSKCSCVFLQVGRQIGRWAVAALLETDPGIARADNFSQEKSRSI